MQKKLFTFLFVIVASIGMVCAQNGASSELVYLDSIRITYFPPATFKYDTFLVVAPSPFGTKYAGDIVIPDSVEIEGQKRCVISIANAAFSGCTEVTSVTIPNTVTSIGQSAFYECSSMKTINIPSSVKVIGDQAFTCCFSLTNVIIPTTDISIGYMAFTYVPNVTYPGNPGYLSWGARSVNGYVEGYLVYNDDTKTKLRVCSAAAEGEVVIPASVTELQTYNQYVPIGAFAYCGNITSLVCKAVVPPAVGANSFSYIDRPNIPLYVPAESVEAYQAADEWKEFNPILPIDTQDVEQVSQQPTAKSQKLIKDGQVLILRGDNTYTLQGQEMK